MIVFRKINSIMGALFFALCVAVVIDIVTSRRWREEWKWITDHPSTLTR